MNIVNYLANKNTCFYIHANDIIVDIRFGDNDLPKIVILEADFSSSKLKQSVQNTENKYKYPYHFQKSL